MTLDELARQLEVLPVMAAKIDALLARLEPQEPPSPTMPEPADIWATLDVDAPQAPYHTDERRGNISSLGEYYGPFSRSREIYRAWNGVVPSGQVFAVGDDLRAKRQLVKALHSALNRKPDPNEAPKPTSATVAMIVSYTLQAGVDRDVLYVAILWGAVGPHHFSGFQSLPVQLAGITLETFRSTYLPGEVGAGGAPGIGGTD